MNWRSLSFRVGLACAFGGAALAAAVAVWFVQAAGGQCPLWVPLCFLGAFLLLALFFFFFILKPYRALERNVTLFLQGYDMGPEGAECWLSPAQRKLQKQIVEILNPSELYSMNKRQAQYLALQNQINPHFLYNTLESIRGEAMLSGLDTVADMTEALATFFRYTISKVENLVSVEEELQNCETYFHIQQYRFGKRLALEIACDPEDREAIFLCRLPKLTMQPIVENSVIHGIESKLGVGHISIHLERTDKRLLIRVSDDGVGMDGEALRTLNDRLGKNGLDAARQTKKKGGLALANVDNRIRLLFGDSYGMHVFSTPGVGTDVEISLPMITSDRDVTNREALQ